MVDDLDHDAACSEARGRQLLDGVTAIPLWMLAKVGKSAGSLCAQLRRTATASKSLTGLFHLNPDTTDDNLSVQYRLDSHRHLQAEHRLLNI